jgi:hypothetical protein
MCGDYEDCGSCDGSGEAEDDWEDEGCSACYGTGRREVDHCCQCGGSPYCNCCPKCSAANIGGCACPVSVQLLDGSTLVLPPADPPAPAHVEYAVDHSPEPRLRLRLRYRSWPRPRLVVTDTPRPDCASCDGDGGWDEDYGDSEGEYGGTRQVDCHCCRRDLVWTVLPLPRRPRWLRRRTTPDPWSSEPPF